MEGVEFQAAYFYLGLEVRTNFAYPGLGTVQDVASRNIERLMPPDDVCGQGADDKSHGHQFELGNGQAISHTRDALDD